MIKYKTMTNEKKAEKIVKSLSVIYDDWYLLAIKAAINMAKWKDEQLKEQRRIIRNHWQEWAKEQIKNQEQTLLWTVEHILDRLCIEGEAREIAIKEFTNDLQYYNETEYDSKE